MRLSELIELAKNIQDEYGDLDTSIIIKEGKETTLADIIVNVVAVEDDDDKVFCAAIVVEDEPDDS